MFKFSLRLHFLVTFNIFLLVSFSWSIICLGNFIFGVHPAWYFLSFLVLWLCVCHPFWSISSHYFNYLYPVLSCSFGFSVVCMLCCYHFILSHSSWMKRGRKSRRKSRREGGRESTCAKNERWPILLVSRVLEGSSRLLLAHIWTWLISYLYNSLGGWGRVCVEVAGCLWLWVLPSGWAGLPGVCVCVLNKQNNILFYLLVSLIFF